MSDLTFLVNGRDEYEVCPFYVHSDSTGGHKCSFREPSMFLHTCEGPSKLSCPLKQAGGKITVELVDQ